MRNAFRGPLLAVFLLSALPTLVHAELDCTDFLTVSFPGNAKLPQDAFDYNTSIRVLRVSSGRVDSFDFGDSNKGYFFVAAAPYAPLNVSVGDVLYQYTKGVAEFYYHIYNRSAFSWYCGTEKMAELRVTARELSGTFYSSSGNRLEATQVSTVRIDSGIADAFLIPGFGTRREVYLATEENVTGLSVGYLVHDAGNGTFVATDYKQARFHVPAKTTSFCNDWGTVCLDAYGTHERACKGQGYHSYFCQNDVCVTNMTACPYGCENAVCLQPTPTPSPTPVATAPSAPSIAATTMITATAAPTVVPASDSGGLGMVGGLIVLLALAAGAYYVFIVNRRPKGL